MGLDVAAVYKDIKALQHRGIGVIEDPRAYLVKDRYGNGNWEDISFRRGDYSKMKNKLIEPSQNTKYFTINKLKIAVLGTWDRKKINKYQHHFESQIPYFQTLSIKLWFQINSIFSLYSVN